MNLWKIYKGFKLGANKRAVCIFMFDKKNMHKDVKKAYRDDVLNLLKKEPQSLAKFKHPNILSLVEPLVEDERMMAFVTESFDNNLNNYL